MQRSALALRSLVLARLQLPPRELVSCTLPFSRAVRV